MEARLQVRNGEGHGLVRLGLVRAVHLSGAPAGLADALAEAVAARAAPLTPAEEARRTAVRDMLRQGRYKPTGRGKPASEYLLRAAQQPDRTFPRINGPVDVANLMSLTTLLPVSLWDHDRADARAYCFRLGREGEDYVFNAGGQRIDVADLFVGCRVSQAADPTAGGRPIVNPVKDSMATKTRPETTQVMACVYAPAQSVARRDVEACCATFAEWLGQCGPEAESTWAVAEPGTTAVL